MWQLLRRRDVSGYVSGSRSSARRKKTTYQAFAAPDGARMRSWSSDVSTSSVPSRKKGEIQSKTLRF